MWPCTPVTSVVLLLQLMVGEKEKAPGTPTSEPLGLRITPVTPTRVFRGHLRFKELRNIIPSSADAPRSNSSQGRGPTNMHQNLQGNTLKTEMLSPGPEVKAPWARVGSSMWILKRLIFQSVSSDCSAPPSDWSDSMRWEGWFPPKLMSFLEPQNGALSANRVCADITKLK